MHKDVGGMERVTLVLYIFTAYGVEKVKDSNLTTGNKKESD